MSLPRPLVYLFSISALLLAYATSFQGEPLWDDHQFIFWRFLEGTPDYVKYWRHHIWPVFDTFAAMYFRVVGSQVVWWHGLSFLLHIVNGFLLRKIIQHFKPQWGTPLMVLFWIHPLNVLSVAWMVQIKTVMCGTFLLTGICYYLKDFRTPKPRYRVLSVLSYTLSVLTKSASLPFPWMALVWVIYYKKKRSQNLLVLLPFLLISATSAWRIWRNEMVQTNVTHTEKEILKRVEPPPVVSTIIPDPVPVVPSKAAESKPIDPVVEPSHNESVIIPTTSSDITVEAPHEAPQIEIESKFKKILLLAHTSATYVALPWAPWPLSPVHGAYKEFITPKVLLGFAILILCLILCWWYRSLTPLLLLLSQLAALTPFIGIVVAPYMSYTSVSEQHFYLVLPIALSLQFWLIMKLYQPLRRALIGGLILGCFFLTQTYVQAFKNELVFYNFILKYRPEDRLAIINLAGYFAQNGQPTIAFKITRKAMQDAEENPTLKNDPLHHVLEYAHNYYAGLPDVQTDSK